jgi:hypothetical protein
MDFKSLISKINSMADPIETVKAPVLPQAVQLNEDAQMRVLAGQSTVLAEAKKQKEEEAVAEEMNVGDSKKTAKGGTVTKTKTGIVHKAAPGNYGGSDDKDTDPDADDEPKAKKAKKESIDTTAFKGKFAKMVEAKKDEKKDTKKKPMKEAAKPDFLDIDKDGDKKEPMKKAAADKGGDKPAGKKGMSAKQEKFFGKKTESKMMPKGKKRPVKESVEGKLTFKDMVKLVQESGGQQQIDAKDDALFQWAQRVAVSKLGEGVKAELYAGLIYERNGGVFEMYDVLSETK